MTAEPEPLPQKPYYRVDEVARYFGVSRHTIYRLIAEGELPATRVRRSLRIRAADLKELELVARLKEEHCL